MNTENLPSRIPIKDFKIIFHFSNFKKLILLKLENNLLFSQTYEELAYHILKCFDYKEKKENHLQSIIDGCKLILDELNVKYEDKTVLITFVKKLIGIRELPYKVKLELEQDAKDALRALDKLIDKYEKEKIIIIYKKDGQKARNHSDKRIINYYKRCVSEKEKIIKYLLYEMDGICIKTAMNNEQYTHEKLTSLIRHPYLYYYLKNTSYYEFEKLDLFKHKIPNEINKILKNYLTETYRAFGKEKFYKELFKVYSPNKIFDSINNKTKQLPFLRKRIEIFKELKSLFNLKKWYGFYSLALPQIEGIFSEMNKVLTSESSMKSLPDKVSIVRNSSQYTWEVFDYYEYYMPEQRNKFAHYGQDDDIKYKSFDLLCDLNHLLEIFSDLDAPLVKLKKLIYKNNLGNFSNIDSFNIFSDLIEEIKNQKLITELQDDLISIKNQMRSKRIIDFIYTLLPEEIEKCINTIAYEISHFLLGNDYKKDKPAAFPFDNQFLPEIKKYLETFSLLIHDEIKLYKEIRKFIYNYDNKFIKLSQKSKNIRIEILEKYKLEFNNINHFLSKSDVILFDDYIQKTVFEILIPLRIEGKVR